MILVKSYHQLQKNKQRDRNIYNKRLKCHLSLYKILKMVIEAILFAKMSFIKMEEGARLATFSGQRDLIS